MYKVIISIAALALLLGLCETASAAGERFPPPEFTETDHQIPSPTTPEPRQDIFSYIDTGVLVGALVLASFLALKARSRKWLFALMVFALLYFGFYRMGCVCPIGAIQNVTLTFFDKAYTIPIVVTAFFLLPLAFTLFFGRTFCGAVCPLGAIQDAVVWRPIRIPLWLESTLRLIGYTYLAAAILFAATGAAFIICRYDPFVSFFRLSGGINLLIFGGCLLLIGLFIGRPYCRFLCPYGMILRQFSRVSRRKVTITPDECIKCRLCEDACPFNAIREPTPDWPAREYAKAKKRLALLLLLVPVLIAAGAWVGSSLWPVTARAHATVRLAERVRLENQGEVEGTTDASDAFRATGQPAVELYEQANTIRDQFRFGGWFFGGFIGLVAGVKLVGSSIRRRRNDYEADRASCFACGRCYKYCPRHRVASDKKEAVTA